MVTQRFIGEVGNQNPYISILPGKQDNMIRDS